MTIFYLLISIAIILFAIIFIIGWETTLKILFGEADQGRTVFKTLKRPKAPNNALICPLDFCDNARPDMVAPVYNLSVDDLRDKLRASLKREQRLEHVHANDPALRERYVQRSRLFRFADTIQVEYIPLDHNISTIALYSHVQIGISDGGVNLKRLKRWLKRLQAFERC